MSSFGSHVMHNLLCTDGDRSTLHALVCDQNFRGGRGGGWGGGSSERCLKWGGGGGVIKGSFQKNLKTGVSNGKSCS